MFIGDSRQMRGAGILPLDSTPEREGLDFRASLLGVRVVGRDRLDGGSLGHWIYDDQTIGDVVGGHFWQAERNERIALRQQEVRPIPMWRFATPVVIAPPTNRRGRSIGRGRTFVVNPEGVFPEVRLPGGEVVRFVDRRGEGGVPPPAPVRIEGECATSDPLSIRPVFNFQFHEDQRFQRQGISQGPTVPQGFDRAGLSLWKGGKFPHGYVGISLVADAEGQQQPCFHPTDKRLVAVNFSGDFSMGTLVGDLKKEGDEFSIDPDRVAFLQSFFRVIKDPSGCGGKIGQPRGRTIVGAHAAHADLAWNLYKAGCDDSHGGWVFDVDKKAIGHVGAVFGGPWLIVDEFDKHNIGKDADNNPIAPVHIQIEALFATETSSEDFDGPLDFELGLYPNPPSCPDICPVHLVWDPVPVHNIGACGTATGKWRWYAETPDCQVPPSEPQRPGVFAPEPSTIPGQFLDDDDPRGGIVRGARVGPQPLPALPLVGRPRPTERQILHTLAERAVPALLFRVQHFGSDRPDLRNVMNPNKFQDPRRIERAGRVDPGSLVVFPPGVDPALFDLAGDVRLNDPQGFVDSETPSGKNSEMEDQIDQAPLALRLEGFAKEDGQTWVFSQPPGELTVGRYPLPAARGGAVFTPPELGLEDYLDGTYVEKTPSEACVVVPPSVRLCFGVPNRATGSANGNYLQWNRVTSELELLNDSAGTERLILSVDVDGNILIKDSNLVPSSNPTAGVLLFVEDGQAKIRGPQGTVTTLAPV